MIKFIYLLTLFFILIISESKSQTLNTDFIDQANALIKKDSSQLLRLKKALTIDSFSAFSNKINLYFNTQSVYKKGELQSDYIEILPEILMPLASQYSADIQLLLFAKEKETNEWKTLDYFEDNKERAIYSPIQNNDPYPSKTDRKSVV